MNIPSSDYFPPDAPNGCWSKERRLEPRMAAACLCEIIPGPRKLPVSGIVLDVSTSGAMLEVSTTTLPKLFLVRCQSWEYAVVCEKVWQSNGYLGVRFRSDISKCPKPGNCDTSESLHFEARQAG